METVYDDIDSVMSHTHVHMYTVISELSLMFSNQFLQFTSNFNYFKFFWS